MINLFITASKYIQLLLIVLYTYCNYSDFYCVINF